MFRGSRGFVNGGGCLGLYICWEVGVGSKLIVDGVVKFFFVVLIGVFGVVIIFVVG